MAGAALAVAAAGPAAAKGPQSVTVAPPGGDPVELAQSERPQDTRIVRLAEDMGIWETTGEGQALLPEAPTEYLGPELTVEWTMYNSMPANPDAAPRVVQTLYPQAGGGALVHTEGGQRFFGESVTKPGWFRAPDRLVATLEALGVEAEFRLPEPAPAPAAAGATARPGESRAWPVPALAGAVVVSATTVTGLATHRVVRRRRRDAATAVA
jgi:hypothetical protein